jgi:hypothetical protein
MAVKVTRGKQTIELELGDRESDFIEKCSKMIEMTLEAFGIFVKVREISIEKDYYEYLMDVAVGTSFTRLERRTRELAMALATTGKLRWRMSVSGKALVGLIVPKPPREYYEAVEKEEKRKWEEKSLKNRLALSFYLIGKTCFMIAYRILGESKEGTKS